MTSGFNWWEIINWLLPLWVKERECHTFTDYSPNHVPSFALYESTETTVTLSNISADPPVVSLNSPELTDISLKRVWKTNAPSDTWLFTPARSVSSRRFRHTCHYGDTQAFPFAWSYAGTSRKSRFRWGPASGKKEKTPWHLVSYSSKLGLTANIMACPVSQALRPE